VTAASDDGVPAIGSKAPEFSLPSNRGKNIGLADLKGHRSVLYFYPGDFTQGCTIEAQAFQRDLGEYQKLGVDIYGVSVDNVEKHLDFSKSYGLGFPLLSDAGGVVSKSYGSLLDFGFLGKFSNRQTYIISPDLNIEAVFTDVESRLAKHSDEVLSKLTELKK
jgi:peroxiredoxin Q/BCP